MNAFIRLIAVGFAGTILWAACGGDDSNGSEDWTATCKKTCSKLVQCLDAGTFPINCDQSCASGSDGGGSGGSCTNDAARAAKAKECLEKDCQELFACFESIPDCEGGGTGSGGNGGTGGAGGTGGSGGSAGSPDGGGATCATLLACCNAATDANIKMACLSTHTNAMGSDMICSIAYNALRMTVCP